MAAISPMITPLQDNFNTQIENCVLSSYLHFHHERNDISWHMIPLISLARIGSHGHIWPLEKLEMSASCTFCHQMKTDQQRKTDEVGWLRRQPIVIVPAFNSWSPQICSLSPLCLCICGSIIWNITPYVHTTPFIWLTPTLLQTSAQASPHTPVWWIMCTSCVLDCIIYPTLL